MSNFCVPWHLPFPFRDLSTTKALITVELSHYFLKCEKTAPFYPNNQIPTGTDLFQKTMEIPE